MSDKADKGNANTRPETRDKSKQNQGNVLADQQTRIRKSKSDGMKKKISAVKKSAPEKPTTAEKSSSVGAAFSKYEQYCKSASFSPKKFFEQLSRSLSSSPKRNAIPTRLRCTSREKAKPQESIARKVDRVVGTTALLTANKEVQACTSNVKEVSVSSVGTQASVSISNLSKINSNSTDNEEVQTCQVPSPVLAATASITTKTEISTGESSKDANSNKKVPQTQIHSDNDDIATVSLQPQAEDVPTPTHPPNQHDDRTSFPDLYQSCSNDPHASQPVQDYYSEDTGIRSYPKFQSECSFHPPHFHDVVHQSMHNMGCDFQYDLACSSFHHFQAHNYYYPGPSHPHMDNGFDQARVVECALIDPTSSLGRTPNITIDKEGKCIIHGSCYVSPDGGTYNIEGFEVNFLKSRPLSQDSVTGNRIRLDFSTCGFLDPDVFEIETDDSGNIFASGLIFSAEMPSKLWIAVPHCSNPDSITVENAAPYYFTVEIPFQ